VKNEFPDEQLPDRFVRLVYCLGYGEDWLCHGQNKVWKNSSTSFWKTFARIAGMPPPGQGSRSSVRVKAGILRSLRARGIWLVDASVFGVYRTLDLDRLAINDYMIQRSFSRYVWPNVKDEPIEDIWIMSEGVGRALLAMPEIDGMPALVPEQVIPNNERGGVAFDDGLDRLIAAAAKFKSLK
jgi:hypothetical protein